jgi:hypothetical protein
MTKAGARSMSLIAVGITVAATTVSNATDPEGFKIPPLTMAIGAVILLVMLFIASEWIPDLAGAFAVLILLSGLVANGEALGSALQTSTGFNKSGPKPI